MNVNTYLCMYIVYGGDEEHSSRVNAMEIATKPLTMVRDEKNSMYVVPNTINGINSI